MQASFSFALCISLTMQCRLGVQFWLLRICILYLHIGSIRLTKNDWGELQILPIKEKWYSLGLKLGINSQELDKIKQNEASNQFKCQVRMLKMWLQGDQEVTWEKLINALHALNEIDLATDLQDHINHRLKQSDGISEGDAIVTVSAYFFANNSLSMTQPHYVMQCFHLLYSFE